MVLSSLYHINKISNKYYSSSYAHKFYIMVTNVCRKLHCDSLQREFTFCFPSSVWGLSCLRGYSQLWWLSLLLPKTGLVVLGTPCLLISNVTFNVDVLEFSRLRCLPLLVPTTPPPTSGLSLALIPPASTQHLFLSVISYNFDLHIKVWSDGSFCTLFLIHTLHLSNPSAFQWNQNMNTCARDDNKRTIINDQPNSSGLFCT